MRLHRNGKIALLVLLLIVALGAILPEQLVIPVQGATQADWNHETFWHQPWGASVVHKGIDIFGSKGTAVLAPTYGLVLYRGHFDLGGNVVLIIGPKWRVHYLAHLDTIHSDTDLLVRPGTEIGKLGDSGNAAGKQPHTHYSIVTLIPYPWKMTAQTQGWKKMFYLNPHEKLNAH